MSVADADGNPQPELNGNKIGGGGWFGHGGDVDTNALVLFASSRVDSMHLRLRLLGALLKAPLRSKAATLRLLHISRQYLGRILREWRSLDMIDIRDMSPYDSLMPVMALHLVKRPVISITWLNGDSEEIKDVPRLKGIIPAITSKARQTILTVLGKSEDNKEKADRPPSMTVKKLQDKLGGKGIHRHVRVLLRARFLLKLRAPETGWWRRGGSISVMRNYRNIRFQLQPYTYHQEQQ